MHARFCGDVIDLVELAGLPVHRTYIDDTAPFVRHHVGVDLLAHVEEGIEVDAEYAVPLSLFHILKFIIRNRTSIID